VRALPGVTSAALATSGVPVGPFNTSSSVLAEGASDVVLAYGETVTPEYFDTLGIALRRGRVFTSGDRFGQTRVTIINETMARRLWPNQDPIGKRLGADGDNPNWREVVGVVADVTYPSFASTSPIDTDMQAFQPLAQNVSGAVSIILRTADQADAIAPGLAREVAALDRDLPVYNVMTARASELRSTAGLRLMSNVLGAFALLGLVLAGVGIFGVVSYSTAQRAGELGMRMALGARQSVVLWLVLKQGVGLTLVGAIAGLAGGLALARVLSSMMPNLPAPELSIILAVFACMVAVALAAFSIPAWKASKTNPMLVLRHE
jgi:predicted permease